MKKRAFILPLAVSVAALAGGSLQYAQAAVTVSLAPSAHNVSFAVPSSEKAPLVLDRASGPGVILVDHSSHSSHDSHSSHASHSSGY